MNQWLKSTTSLVNHWFIPYKVGRERQSFQYGTTELLKTPTGLTFGLEAKNVPTDVIFHVFHFH